MLYHIQYSPQAGMGMAGFNVLLFPAWKDAVAECESFLNQKSASLAIKNIGADWLDAHGYDDIFDPDNCGCDKDERKPPGPEARRMYDPGYHLRVSWGEWGPEHLTVPGNACGLDIDSGIGAPRGGKVLVPHNVDTITQASLLLTMFLFFADTIVMNQLNKE